ncbi:glucodextranase DOMON-like domain-containing protein [Natranaeroarchaeum aerophilus]|uniref:Alpha-amylase family glycosyl hydrolase n=1 Tax=Natranaeroarchaeum aerophilus TaxID=2917711 RepID=A0AAE3FPL6_9EURY|nr:glucodextranase DOMON-like domain-containing protein [Natranaeroarchaeum aerophilus]MCL9812299.1 alpha-amylase family glycosyl hydrolase [Natranaeroarchaeum aerophilus]
MSNNNSNLNPDLGRRTVLGGMAGLGALSFTSMPSTAELMDEHGETHASGPDSHHPGHPRFVEVGEQLSNPEDIGGWSFDPRDNLSPRIPDFERDPDNYDADEFEWSIAEKPADSDAELEFEQTHDSAPVPRYSTGDENVAEFVADVPGTYILELDAPDGTHQMTIHAFPEGDGARPKVELDGEYGGGEFTLAANPELAPASRAATDDLEVVFLADDRDALDTDDIETDGHQATVPESALGGETGRVHVAAHDGHARSMLDTIELDQDGSIHYPNRAPEWMEDGVMYQIFPRSWGGERGQTTFDTLINGDEETGARGLDYIEELGVDALWLTPVVPAESVDKLFLNNNLSNFPEDQPPGGGPHGYDTNDYFGIAEDLVPEGKEPVEAYKEFVDACHERDIKVVFDIVINHAGRGHPYFQDTIASQDEERTQALLDANFEYPAINEWDEDSKYFDWWDRVEAAGTVEGLQENPTAEIADPAPTNTGFFGLRVMPNFNYDNVAVREHMLAVADFWSGEVGVDGFRCDIAWGVPNSMWKDIREVVRENNSEYLMLDETIPKDPTMSENAFDMHFDTEGFTGTSHSVASGDTGAESLISTIEDRENQGFPNFSLILNLIENHDEERLLNNTVVNLNDPPEDPSEIPDEEWEYGAKRQRAAWAAGVGLPGVPSIYYGQERQISRWGESRWPASSLDAFDEDNRGRDDAGNIDTAADVREGGKQRAFMNWEEYDEDHLQFYKDVIDTYHELDVLKPAAELRNAYAFTQDTPNMIVFGRDASELDDVDGPESVIVIANFEEDTVSPILRPEVDGTNLVTGENIATNESDTGITVEVDTFAVLETPSLFSLGDMIIELSAERGTDAGPGTYEYPTGDDFDEGVFDLTRFDVHQSKNDFQFAVEVDGDLTNPWGYDHGISHQHLQVYIRDPDADGGSTDAREGVNATFEAPYQYRVVADGEHGVRVEDADGNELATGELTINNANEAMLFEFPRDAIEGNLDQMAIAPLMLGYDSSASGNVRPVEAEAGPEVFGGAENDSAPNVIDMAGDASVEDALGYSDGTLAEIPYSSLVAEFEEIEQFETGTGGEPYGPDQYTYPTGDDFYEGTWDLSEVTIYESPARVQFEFTMAEDIQNNFGLDPVSHQFVQIYINSPEADGPEGVEGRPGTNFNTAVPHHTRVLAHGEGTTDVEDAEGEPVSGDVEYYMTDSDKVAVDFPKSAVDWTDDVSFAAIITPFDGFGEGDIRAINPEPGEYSIGGGDADADDPAAMDLLLPEGESRADVLTYDADTTPEIPLVALGDAEPEPANGEENGEDDEADDDDGLPGFGVAAGAAGVGAGALAAKRLSENSEEEAEE